MNTTTERRFYSYRKATAAVGRAAKHWGDGWRIGYNPALRRYYVAPLATLSHLYAFPEDDLNARAREIATRS
ncbi:MAG: hypothetical protein ACRBI6_04695 [Acidimicrobiales bacterium]